MDNGSTGVPQFELPRASQPMGGETAPMYPNMAPAPQEMQPQAGNQPGAPMPPVVPSMLPTAPAAAQPAPAQVPVSPPAAPPISANLMAEDADLIEKAWVDKAKEIVERTRNDPYLQNREITKMKADYLKKRYNKDIKVPES